jgi:pilus assembly protein CpaF
MGHLLHSALRLRPDRIIVGEVRGGEAFDLMQAMNTGHGGSMATVHANTPTDALRRLEALCLMSAVEMPMVAVRAQVASAINFIVCCERFQDGSRKTIAISEVLPLTDKGEYRTQDLWLYVPVAKDESGKILGYHAPTGILPTFMQKARAYGFEDLDEKFFDPATYGVPPPPLIHGLGEQVTTRWAPSLKHREKHIPDPEEFKERWREFEAKLKADAKAKNAEGKPTGAVQVPAGPTPAAQRPAPPSRPAQAQPAARPAPGKDDVTPPPTRNPLKARRPPPGPAETGDEEALGDAPDEPSVQVADELLEEEPEASDPNSTNIRPNPLLNTPNRRPAPAAGQRPPPGKPPPKR